MKTPICHVYCVIDGTKTQPNEGGGGQSFKDIISNLKEVGFEVKIITPNNDFLEPDRCDLVCMIDAWNDPTGSRWFTTDQTVSILNSRTPLVMVEMAYTSFTTKPYGDDRYDNNFCQFTKNFFIRAKKVILSSPLHREEVQKFVGYELSNVYLYLRELNSERFKNLNMERDIPYLYVGAINRYKGIENAVSLFRDRGLTVYGYGESYLVPPDLFKGKISHSKLAEILNRTVNFVHLPLWAEPFGRTVAEAALCGCHIITNENCGAISWNIDLSNPEIYKNSKKEFQNMLCGLCV